MTDHMVASGRVLAAHEPGRLDVELTQRHACPGCRCGRLALGADLRRAEIRLDGQIPVAIGAEILVTMPASAVLRASLCLHGVPLLGLLAGAVIAAAAGFGDLGCLAGAIAGFTGALLLLRRARQRWYRDVASGMRVVPTA